jgi:hypothetical protein
VPTDFSRLKSIKNRLTIDFFINVLTTEKKIILPPFFIIVIDFLNYV